MTKNCNGWLKLHRKLLNWEWYHDTNTRLVFIHLLLTANYEPSTYKGKIIQEGQRVYNRNELANEVGISVQKLRTALDKLKATNEITITSTNKGSVLTIGKWGLYQDRDHASNQQNNPQSNQQKSNPLLNPLPNQQKSNKVTSKKTAKSTVNGGVIEIEEFRSNQQNNSELTSNLTRYSTSLIKDNKKLRREEDKKNYIKKREDENCEDGFIFEDVENSDQNELQGNLSKHSEIEPSFQETKGKSPKADKVIAEADKVMVSRDTKRIDDDLGNAGISLEVWEGYREMRKKMRKPLTDRAEQLAIKKAVLLSVKCRCTPDDIIDQSTMNGWLGLFEIKTITTTYGVKQNEAIRQNTNSTPAERGREANQKYLEELEQRAIQSGYTDEMESEGRSYGC